MAFVMVAGMVKNLPAMQETHVGSLSQEDPLEKGMTIHSNIFAWIIPSTEEPGGSWGSWGSWEPGFMGSQRVGPN